MARMERSMCLAVDRGAANGDDHGASTGADAVYGRGFVPRVANTCFQAGPRPFGPIRYARPRTVRRPVSRRNAVLHVFLAGAGILRTGVVLSCPIIPDIN